jgi:single-stranded-DNA-specific exonuclease
MWGFAERRPVARHFLDVGHSVTGRAWRSRLDARGEAVATAMAQRGIASESLARVLAGRGIEVDSARAFLAPSLKQDLPDPSSLADMDVAAARLADAVVTGENVAIFGDYDVDGATSAALLHGVLAALGPAPRIYIPDRIFEGYGPNPEAIDNLGRGRSDADRLRRLRFHKLRRAGAGAGLATWMSWSSTTIRSARIAAAYGDRQSQPAGRRLRAGSPGARRRHVSHRNSALSRASAARLRRRVARSPDLLTSRHSDRVRHGPLTGVNRAYVAKGLIALRQTERLGVRALMHAARLNSAPDCGHLGFLLGPRINAGGRIGEATLGARLLTTNDPSEAERIAELLDRLNSERQAIEFAAVAVATAEAEAEIGGGEGPPLLLAGREGWHPGVVGLVAARLKERFCRPAFAIAWSGDVGTGSGRSIPGVDIGAAVRAAVEEGVLAKGGGHAMAAGITVRRENLGALRAFLEARLAPGVWAADAGRTLDIDGALTESGATLAFVDELERAGPFGSGNPAPVFVFPAHRIVFADPAGNGHVRVSLSAGGGGRLKAIAFRAADSPLGRALLASRGKPLHVAGTLCLDHWGGSARPQLRILDVAETDGRL